jgi:NAD(P)-dependent dehydrogenase (short-subunit alcohol dehydrogenase family)
VTTASKSSALPGPESAVNIRSPVVIAYSTAAGWSDIGAHRHVTADGLKHTFALNHLAPFLLTSLLLDRPTASAPAQIVTVSSGAHARARIDFDDLQGERTYSGQRAYARTAPMRSCGHVSLERYGHGYRPGRPSGVHQ